MPNEVARRDGSADFSGGINSIAVTTLSSPLTPAGLKRNELAWGINLTMRDGGLYPRAGWLHIAEIFGSDGLFQGFWPYRPVGAFPYFMAVVNGNILKIDPDTGAVTNLSQLFNLYNNPTEPHAYYVQAEEFALFQSGDGVTLPLIWDNVTLRRSNGITGNVGQPGPAVYTITTTNFFVVPGVGGMTGVITTANTDGLPNGITIELRAAGGGFLIGTFVTSNVVLNTSFRLTTVSSAWIGHNFPPTEYLLTDTAPFVPVLINEIPAATAMVYYMYRIFYAQDRLVSGGDLVFGPSGTAAYGFRDSVLKVTENPLAIGGDGFIVPSLDGNIRGLAYGANINVSNGQGRLFIFTIKAVYALQIPINRDDWIAAGENNTPLMTVVQLANGSVNDRSIVAVNGDLFYQSLEPGIRSLNQADRLFGGWANISLSANENRILQFNDRSLLHAASGIFFNNRLLQTALPRQTPQGIVHDSVIPLDVMPVSSFNQQRQPNWEGSHEGIPFFQMQTADFGGRERAFGIMRSSDGGIEWWEITQNDKFDYASDLSEESRRISWRIEFPAFTWGNTIGEAELKKLVGAWIWVDLLFGTVEFELFYIPDSATCPIPWMQWKECSPKNTAELLSVPPGYPIRLGPCYRNVMAIPIPPNECAPCGVGRPANLAYQFQPILQIRGSCRVRAIWLWAEGPQAQCLYPQSQMVC